MNATTSPLRIAIQKSGRLYERSLQLLERAGMDFDRGRDALSYRCRSFPLEIMLMRSVDIPAYVQNGACALGIVGRNVLDEQRFRWTDNGQQPPCVVRELGFGRCRLALALPNATPYERLADLEGKRIATSYPNSLRHVMNEAGVKCRIVELKGSVELAPALGIADAICDLVETGNTLRSHGQRAVETLSESEAVLLRTPQTLASEENGVVERLSRRIDGALKAARSKYIMMNAPKDAVPAITSLIPGMEVPTVMPLAGSDERVALHAVSSEEIFWETMERLKDLGASSILVMPIEKIIS